MSGAVGASGSGVISGSAVGTSAGSSTGAVGVSSGSGILLTNCGFRSSDNSANCTSLLTADCGVLWDA